MDKKNGTKPEPSAHTATPWVVRKYGGPINGAIIEDAHGRGYFSGIVHAIQRDAHPIHGGGVSQHVAEANAEFITLACNAHDDLVKALQAFVDTAGIMDRETGETREQEDSQLFADARAALAKAGAA